MPPSSARNSCSLHFSPVRLLASDRCLLSIRYGNLLTISTQQTALDAPSLVFLMCSIPGAPPPGTLRVSKSVPYGFVPSAGTCSLRPSPCLQPQGQALGATLRAAVAVQIVCPDDLSLNHTNLPGVDLDIRRMPAGGAPWMGRINYGYAFGRRHPLRAQICQEQIWTSAGRLQGVRQGRRTSKILRDHRINW